MPDPAPTAHLDFQITLAAWRRVPRLRARLKHAAQVTADHLPKKLRFPFSATVLLSGNAKLRQLNRDFRGIDKPTNVLSFPQFSPEQLAKIGKSGEQIELGDIALAYQYTASEARADDKILLDHITHLVIHGLLHLFGYDHMQEGEAEAMEKLEMRIMKAMDLPNPYAEEDSHPPTKSLTKATAKRTK